MARPYRRALLRLVSAHYQAVDEERRGIVQSMRLMADEARAMAHEVRTQSSEHLQVILDHIKDVVLTVDEEGVIRTFHPTGERVFGFGEAEVVGERIDLLIPKIAQHESVPQALQRLAAAPATRAWTWPRAIVGPRATAARFPRARGKRAREPPRGVCGLPAGCHGPPRIRAGHARERGALSPAGGSRSRSHRRARCRRGLLRRRERKCGTPVRPRPRAAAACGPCAAEPPLQRWPCRDDSRAGRALDASR
jgi:PAS domain-containing protein